MESIRAAGELRGSKYIKNHTTKATRAALWSGPFAMLGPAFALTTGPTASAMLRMEGKAIFQVIGGDNRLKRRKGANNGSSLMDRRWASRWLVLASRVMKGRGSGLVGDLVLGVVGALLGGFLAQALLKIPNAVNGINVTSILVAFLGAVILIALLRAVTGRRRLL